MKRISLVLVSLLWWSPLCAATYYVDFVGGSDAAAGAISTPWQHIPGDPNATSNSDSAKSTLTGGDTICIKGGVDNRARVTMYASGVSDGSRIIFDGSCAGFGTGKATINGADLISDGAWTVCANAGACGGNTNYANIYKANLPAAATFWSPLQEGTTMLYMTQNPAYSDPFWWDDLTNAWSASAISQTQLTDAVHLTSASSTYYDQSYVITHGGNNSLYIRKITAFNTSTATITYDSMGAEPYAPPNAPYSILNNIMDLTSAGKFYIDASTTPNTIYLWPNSGPPSGISMSTRTRGFDLNGQDYITVKNLIFRNQYCLPTDSGPDGSGIGNSSGKNDYITIQDSEFRNIQTLTAHQNAIGIGGSYDIVTGNTFNQIRGGRGISVGSESDHTTITNNTITKVGFSSIYCNCNSATICDNTVSSLRGTHANGIAVYETGSQDVTICRNSIVLSSGNNELAMENTVNANIYSNLFKSTAGGGSIIRSTCSGAFNFYGNTFAGPGLSLRPESGATWVIKNNILTALGPPDTDRWTHITHENNLYIGPLDYMQDSRYGWTTGTGELNITGCSPVCSVAADLTSSCFTDAAGGDYSIVTGCIAKDAGATLGAPYNVDILGTSRPQGSAWDIGAYEYASGDSTAPTVTVFTATTNPGQMSATIELTCTDAGGLATLPYAVTEAADCSGVSTWYTSVTTFTYTAVGPRPTIGCCIDAAGNRTASSTATPIISKTVALKAP